MPILGGWTYRLYYYLDFTIILGPDPSGYLILCVPFIIGLISIVCFPNRLDTNVAVKNYKCSAVQFSLLLRVSQTVNKKETLDYEDDDGAFY